MLASMFNEYNKPFYKSALPMELDIIPLPSYTDFCSALFTKMGKTIEKDAITFTYHLLGANTYEMQQVMNIAFALTPDKGTATEKIIEDSIDTIIYGNDSMYRELFSKGRSNKEMNLLQCLATEGIASGLTSEDMIAKYSLGGSSSVQYSLKKLMNPDKIVVYETGNRKYRLQDRFFELWICGQIGILEAKYAAAESLFLKERGATGL